MTISLTRPVAPTEERYVVLSDPRPGTVVELGAGSQLAVRFRRPLGASRWHLAGLPGHLLSLPVSDMAGHGFQFLVFRSAGSTTPVRFERRHPDRDIAHEVCELLVVPVGDDVRAPRGAAARTSRSASPRTA
jgi:hypothetical protein